MARTIRVVCANTLYEIVPRAREGLPLPPTETTNQLLKGILARTQRDQKVTLCNFVDMNNHSHQHVIPDDAHKHVKFYMEYQKKVTDTVRKLTKLGSLQLWEKRPSVVRLVELEDAIQRLCYMFLNPVKAGLVRSIDEYPGLSTWHVFKMCEPSVDAAVTIQAHWTPVSVLEALPKGNRLSPATDREMAKRLRTTEGTREYQLEVKPLAWLKTYGVTDPIQIEAIRERIIKTVYAEESLMAKKRIEERRSFLGADRLRQQPYLRPHTPKRKERRIFVICGNDRLRPEIIASHKEISRRHRHCYRLLKEGLPHTWPPGTFIPWVPPKECYPAPNPGFCWH